MSRIIEFTGKELNQLINEQYIAIGLSSRTVHVCPVEEGSKEQEVIMNWEGDGYRPVKVTIEFEYDEDLKLTEDDD